MLTEVTYTILYLYLAPFDYDGNHYKYQLDEAFFREHLLMIQMIEGYKKEHTKLAYQSNYDEISDSLKTRYTE